MVSFDIRSTTLADTNDVGELVIALLAAVAPGEHSFEQLLPVTARVLRHSDDVFRAMGLKKLGPGSICQ